MEAYDFFLTELFVILCGGATAAGTGAFLLGAALAPLAARRAGAACALARASGDGVTAVGTLRFAARFVGPGAGGWGAAPLAAAADWDDPLADFALAVPLPFVPL